jgi:HK97 family phage major capsid protein
MELEDLKRGIAEVGEYVRERKEKDTALEERVNLTHEEMQRLTERMNGLLEGDKERRRAALLASHGASAARVVYRSHSGYSKEVDALDLAIIGAMVDSAERQPKDMDGRLIAAWRENFDAAQRAMDTGVTGGGAEIVPTLMAASLWADVNLATSVAGLIPEVPQPSPEFDLPVQLGDVNWFPGVPNTATTSTTPATAKRVLSAKELVAMVPWSYNLDEDAVIAMLPELRASLVRNAAEVLDDVYINADTAASGNINHDSATLTVSEAGKAQYLLGWNGLARIPLVDNTDQQVNQSAAPNADMFNNARAKLGKYGVLPSQVVHVMNIETWIKSQTVEQLRTLDKFGPQATILTGQLGAVEGIPAIVSEQLKLAPAGGKVHATTGNTTGRMLTFNRTQYTRGTVRGLLIETERDIQKRQTVMVASMRISFIGRVAASGDTAVSIVRNITV